MTSPFDPNADQRSTPKTSLQEPSVRYNDSIKAQSSYDLSHQRAGQSPNALSDNQQHSLMTYNHVTYLLYVISYLTAGLLWIVPIVMNYAKRHDADNTWLATHFDWQIKTFWYSIVWFIAGLILIAIALGGFGVGIMAESDNIAIGAVLMIGLGLLIILFTVIWHLYRIARGWIALTDKRPVP